MHLLATRIAARGNALTFGGAVSWPLWESANGWHRMETDTACGVIFPHAGTWSWNVVARLFDGEGDAPPCEWGDGLSFHAARNAASVALVQVASRRRRGEVIGPDGWQDPVALSLAERIAALRASIRARRRS